MQAEEIKYGAIVFWIVSHQLSIFYKRHHLMRNAEWFSKNFKNSLHLAHLSVYEDQKPCTQDVCKYTWKVQSLRQIKRTPDLRNCA